MSVNKIRVLLVNDSKYMLQFLQDIINSDAELDVIDTAKDGNEALRKLSRIDVDVVVTDLEMPNLDGISLLSKIMSINPVPVIIVSSYSQEGSQIVFDCLEKGAVDFVSLPHEKQDDISDFSEQLISKIKIADNVNLLALNEIPTERYTVNFNNLDTSTTKIIVVIGASTGGPKVVSSILANIPKHIPAGFILIQHMSKGFTDSYAKRLAKLSSLTIKVAQDGDIIQPGLVLIAPADYHLMIVPPNLVYLDQSPKRFGVRPSINVSMITAAEVFQSKTIGVLLTGMGHDGGFGMKAIKQRGGKTLAQDEESCVVFGMPKEAKELNSVDKFISAEKLAKVITEEVMMLV